MRPEEIIVADATAFQVPHDVAVIFFNKNWRIP
jgi:hypothetical protein